MDIKYENGLPKGYLERRKKSGLLYICSIFLYCLFNLLVNYNILRISDHRAYVILSCLVIITSITLLCNSVLARRNFKGLTMVNCNDYKTFSKLEELLFPIPIIVSAIFIPLNMLIYVGVAIPAYLAVSRTPDAVDKYGQDNSRI